MTLMHDEDRRSYPVSPSQPPQNAALRTVVDLNIFPLLVEKQSRDAGVSATQLAEYTGAERELIGMKPFWSCRVPRASSLKWTVLTRSAM